MEKATRKELFRVAKDMARAPFHGTFDGLVCVLLLHGSGIRDSVQTQ